MTGPVGRAYARLLQDHELKPDPTQERAVAALDRLAQRLRSNGRGLLSLFGKRASGPDGVYLWGGVGRG